MSEWKDEEGASAIRYGKLRLTVHHWVSCGDMWFASCYGIMAQATLDAKDLSSAKTEASALLYEILKEAIDAFRKEMEGEE